MSDVELVNDYRNGISDEKSQLSIPLYKVFYI